MVGVVDPTKDAAEKVVGPPSSTSDDEIGIADGIHEGALLRKLDLRLMPAVGILYLLSFLDRSNGRLPNALVN